MKNLLRAIVAHFTTPRCIYCGTRKDRPVDVCRGAHSFFHRFSDGSGGLITGAAPGPYDDEDD